MRTTGRRIRSGERSRALCDFCGSQWDRDQLTRGEDGLLYCPQEGTGRDVVALTQANIQSAEDWAAQKIPQSHDPGQYQKEAADRQDPILYLLTEADEFILTEAEEPLLGY